MKLLSNILYVAVYALLIIVFFPLWLFVVLVHNEQPRGVS